MTTKSKLRFVDDVVNEPVSTVNSLFPNLKPWTPLELEKFKTEAHNVLNNFKHPTLKAFIELFLANIKFEPNTFFIAPNSVEQVEDDVLYHYYGMNIVYNNVNVHVVFTTQDYNTQAVQCTFEIQSKANYSSYVLSLNSKHSIDFILNHITYTVNSIHSLEEACLKV